jgi:trehalose 6-phosphate synthase/phosphatase
MRHFTASLVRVLGIPADVDRVQLGGREIRVGAFPMGIDARRFATLGDEPAVVAAARDFHGDPESVVFLGLDRLDYTKGIPRRILAFEQLLRRDPTLRERVRLVQIAVPSRTGLDTYQEFRHQLDALVGRVNGEFATPRWSPVHYLHQAFDEQEVAAMYRAADVMLVTPLRDGMNLVSKEFVATRTDEDGVLVLSEFAGAASELAEALQVNPYDVERTADVYQRALAMPPAERRTRMRALRRRVLRNDVHRWSQAFLDALAQASAGRVRDVVAPTPTTEVAALTARLRAAPALLLLLDYDGTLVPFADVPDLASPDAPLVELLRGLAARPRTETHVVSGRSHETLEHWLGDTGVGLHAEHGLWSRPPGGAWAQRSTPAPEWRERVLAILEDFAARTPGALVEEKSSSLAWHYRMADPEFGVFQARELHLHLTEVLSNAPVHVLAGDKVLEVRPHGVHKGTIVAALAERLPAGGIVVAIGDDRTDEELFAALPEGAVAVHVGPQRSRAGVRLATWTDARRFLGALL